MLLKKFFQIRNAVSDAALKSHEGWPSRFAPPPTQGRDRHGQQLCGFVFADNKWCHSVHLKPPWYLFRIDI
jgi:hypothetical protein